MSQRGIFCQLAKKLSLGLVQARCPAARGDPEPGIDVHRDRPEPPQLGLAMPILVKPAYVAAILDDYVVEPVTISRGRL